MSMFSVQASSEISILPPSCQGQSFTLEEQSVQFHTSLRDCRTRLQKKKQLTNPFKMRQDKMLGNYKNETKMND